MAGNSSDRREQYIEMLKQHLSSMSKMFDTRITAEKIKSARIQKNMTQMNLADELEVSYQAVSNWERGSSMPDIGKLAQLCEVLDISVDDLLAPEAAARAKLKQMVQEESDEIPTLEELQNMAVALPPKQLEEYLSKGLERQNTIPSYVVLEQALNKN